MDFFPKLRADAYQWWKNLDASLDESAVKLGLSAEELAEAKASVSAVLTDMGAVEAAESALLAARAKEKATLARERAEMRRQIRYWKTRRGYAASGVEGMLRLSVRAAPFDEKLFKPKLRGRVVGNRIRLTYTKGRCDGVKVYGRANGAAHWTLLGEDKQSPFIDTRPLAQPGVPELREYMVQGYKDERVVGQQSDIFALLYGG